MNYTAARAQLTAVFIIKKSSMIGADPECHSSGSWYLSDMNHYGQNSLLFDIHGEAFHFQVKSFIGQLNRTD